MGGEVTEVGVMGGGMDIDVDGGICRGVVVVVVVVEVDVAIDGGIGRGNGVEVVVMWMV